MEIDLDKPGYADQYRRRIDGHEQEDNDTRKTLNKVGLIAPSQKLRKGMGIQDTAQFPGPFPENGESHEYPEKDIHPGQPEDPHSEKGCSSPKSNNSRCTDESCPVGHGHYIWM